MITWRKKKELGEKKIHKPRRFTQRCCTSGTSRQCAQVHLLKFTQMYTLITKLPSFSLSLLISCISNFASPRELRYNSSKPPLSLSLSLVIFRLYYTQQTLHSCVLWLSFIFFQLPFLWSSILRNLESIYGNWDWIWAVDLMERIVGGKYKLGRKIGSGSFGDIFLGEVFSLWIFSGFFNFLIFVCADFIFFGC